MAERLCVKRYVNWYLNHLLSLGKIYSAPLTAVCGFLFSGSAWEKSRCSTKYKSSNMASVHIVTRTPTHFADPSEISPSSPNQLKLREEWYCEYFCLDRKCLQKASLTELCDFTEDHPVSKTHHQELALSPAQLRVHPFVCIGPFEMPLFQFQRKNFHYIFVCLLFHLP